jgi:hypothetical protein
MQTVEIDMVSNGCFDQSKSEIKLFGGDDRRLTYYRSLNGTRSVNETLELAYDGPLIREIEEQIDLSLRYYREVSNKPGGCTTQERVKVRYLEKGKEVGLESLADLGCYRGALSAFFKDPKDPKAKEYAESIFENPEKYRKMKSIADLLNIGKK